MAGSVKPSSVVQGEEPEPSGNLGSTGILARSLPFCPLSEKCMDGEVVLGRCEEHPGLQGLYFSVGTPRGCGNTGEKLDVPQSGKDSWQMSGIQQETNPSSCQVILSVPLARALS